ncbi:nucleotidyl transferase AbiEii/AbiGii toxin family protein, partial [Proteus mirabilis]
MKIDQENFALLVNKAMQVGNVSHMRSVIEKELLHYDILFALEKGGLLNKLTFQGGTSLRLCYGGNRFSEDLDFAGGKDFSSAMLADMKHCI